MSVYIQLLCDFDSQVVLLHSIAGEFDYAFGNEFHATVSYAFLE